MTHRNSFLTVLEAGGLRLGCWQDQAHQVSLPTLWTATFSLLSSRGRKRVNSAVSSNKDTNPVGSGPLSYIPCMLSCLVISDSLRPHGLQPAQLLCPWGFSQVRILEWEVMPSSRGIFPTQGSNSGLPHCRRILYHLSHQGSPRILERVACPFSRGSSQPRDRTQVSRIAGGFFTS